VIEGFRGIAKTTILEETAIIRALYSRFRFMVILSASYHLACQRLDTIKNALTINPAITSVFGPQEGGTWQEGRIILANGACIQALGRGQKMTGMKYRDWRPDAALVDDVEDPEETLDDADREEIWRWFLRTFIPSLDSPNATWVRVLGTRRGNGSLPDRLEKIGWPSARFPIEYVDGEGARRATWPAKFPLREIDELKRLYRGDMHTFMQEYMCEAVSVGDRDFEAQDFRTVSRTRTWEAVYAWYDPARTIHRTSATTGRVIFSWIGSRLVVWESSGERWQPDQIVAAILNDMQNYNLVWAGVEIDGLEEFIKQPLRQEQLRRNVFIPVKPIRAPRDKYRFIRALQPYFKAGEIEFAGGGHQALIEQLTSFPNGDIDIPNALAYALPLRPAAPVYDGFRPEHVSDRAMIERSGSCWLACNAARVPNQGTMTTVAVLQYLYGRLSVVADFAMEGDPREVVPLIVREAAMLTRRTMTASCAPVHFDQYNNVGLVQALKAYPLEVERGTPPMKGRDFLRDELGRLLKGDPCVRVAREAALTLRAMTGGYTRVVERNGGLSYDAEPGVYKVLMEGIESCVGVMAVEPLESEGNWSVTADGRRYRRYANAVQERRT
jgi:hypothetical protein